MKKLFVLAFAICISLFAAEIKAQPSTKTKTSTKTQPSINTDPNKSVKIDPNFKMIIVNQNFLSNYADKLNEKLKNKSVGYSFTVIGNGLVAVSRVGGDARRAPDANPRKMAWDDKFNIASVSKTITAAAVMKLLNEKKIGVDSPVYPYLPSGWTLGANVKGITFRELLTHRSGIRCDTEVTYTNLKNCVGAGVSLPLKKEQKYNNSNFALFRMIIPKLNGYKDPQTLNDTTASTVFAGLYADYVNNHVFKPLGIIGIEQKAAANNPALAYQFPAPIIAGESFGDMTETGASRGWVLNARQLAMFMNGLIYTELVIPRTVAKQMKDEQLGLWQTNVGGKTVSYEHGGYYPGKNGTGGLYNNGEMNTLVINFPNGISVGVIVNSQFVSNMSIADAARATMNEMTN